MGAWPSKKSINRAINYDGLLPAIIKESSDLAEIKRFIEENRESDTPFDIIVEGRTPGHDPIKAAEIVASYRDAGATWWIEALWDEPDYEKVFARIKQGPPRG